MLDDWLYNRYKLNLLHHENKLNDHKMMMNDGTMCYNDDIDELSLFRMLNHNDCSINIILR